VIRLLSASNGTSSAPSPSYVITQLRGASDLPSTISTRNSSHIESARPMTSNPGPMFAEEQGTSVLRSVSGHVLWRRGVVWIGTDLW
jgi:hypothetical protein